MLSGHQSKVFLASHMRLDCVCSVTYVLMKLCTPEVTGGATHTTWQKTPSCSVVPVSVGAMSVTGTGCAGATTAEQCTALRKQPLQCLQAAKARSLPAPAWHKAEAPALL